MTIDRILIAFGQMILAYFGAYFGVTVFNTVDVGVKQGATGGPDSGAIEFKTTSFADPKLIAKWIYFGLSAIIVTLIWWLYSAEIHAALFWVISLSAIVISIFAALVTALLSEAHSVGGHTRIKDGLISVHDSRNGNELFSFPYAHADEIVVGQGQHKRLDTDIPVYLIANPWGFQPQDRTGGRRWIELFEIRCEEKKIVARINGKKWSYDRKTHSCGDDVLNLADELTAELCDEVHIECGPPYK